MSAREQPRITVWWCDECGYWREQRSTGVHVHYGQNRGGVEHPLRPATFELVRSVGVETQQ